MVKALKASSIALTIVAALAGCAVGPNYKRPEPPVAGGPLCVENCPNRELDVLVSGCPRTDADSHGCPASPGAASAPASAGVLNRSDDAPRPIVIPESDDHLIQDNIVQDFDAGLFQLGGYFPSLVAVAAHQFGQSGTSKRLERRPDSYGPVTPGTVRREVQFDVIVAVQMYII